MRVILLVVEGNSAKYNWSNSFYNTNRDIQYNGSTKAILQFLSHVNSGIREHPSPVGGNLESRTVSTSRESG